MTARSSRTRLACREYTNLLDGLNPSSLLLDHLLHRQWGLILQRQWCQTPATIHPHVPAFLNHGLRVQNCRLLVIVATGAGAERYG